MSWTVAHQAPLSMGFPRQEYWSGLPFPSLGDLSRPRDWTWVFCIGRRILYHWATREAPCILWQGQKRVSKSSWDSQKRAKTSLTMPRRPFHSTLVTVSMTKVLLQIYTTLLSLVNMNSCAEKWVSSWCDLEKKKKSQVSEATKLPCDTLRPLGR